MPAAGEPLRWGIIACGRIAHDFVTALRKAERPHKVVALGASKLGRAEEFGKSHGLNDAKAYGSYNEVLADPNVEIVYIANLNADHCEWIRKAVDAGKAVLCEKPLGVNVKEAKATLEYARGKKFFVMEAFWSRFFPAWKEIRRVIRSGELGAPKHCMANFGLEFNDVNLDLALSPVTMFGLYTVMFTHFIFEKKPVKVTAVGDTKNGLDTFANVTLDYGDGKTAIAYYDSRNFLPQSASISFEKGMLQLPAYFWCPTRLIRVDGEFAVTNPNIHTTDFPLDDNEKYNYNNSSGLRYEADHVYEQLQRGALESDTMSHQDTLDVLGIVDEIRRQLGVAFKHDAKFHRT